MIYDRKSFHNFENNPCDTSTEDGSVAIQLSKPGNRSNNNGLRFRVVILGLPKPQKYVK